jgi:hypothetical protein
VDAPREAYAKLVALADSPAPRPAQSSRATRPALDNAWTDDITINQHEDTSAKDAVPLRRPSTRANAASPAAAAAAAATQDEASEPPATAVKSRYVAHFSGHLTSEELSTLSRPCKAVDVPNDATWQRSDVRKHATITVSAPLVAVEPLPAPLQLSAYGAERPDCRAVVTLRLLVHTRQPWCPDRSRLHIACNLARSCV